MLSLTITRWGGLGDVCMALSAAKAVKNTRIYFNTAPEYYPLVNACVWAEQPSSSTPENTPIIDLSPAFHGTAPYHELLSLCHSLGVSSPDFKQIGLDLVIDSHHYTVPHFLLGDIPYVILHPGITDPNRTLPQAFWDGLVKALTLDGHKVCIIGKSSSRDGRGVYRPKGDYVDLVDQLSLLETVALFRLQGDSCLVSGDSGPIQLAGASDIGIVGIYSVTRGAWRLPFRCGGTTHRTIAIDVPCLCAPCYQLMENPHVAAPEVEALQRGEKTFGQVFSEWCPAGGYSCMQKVSVDEVMEAIKTLTP